MSRSLSCPENRWTSWYDRDNPSGNCDCETLIDLRRENPGEICDEPTEIEARLVSTKAPYTGNLENIQFDTEVGLDCRNGRGQTCDDYEVRFCCPFEGK